MKKIILKAFDRSPGRRAQGMVEFAIVLPLLLLMLYGITELGRALYQQNRSRLRE